MIHVVRMQGQGGRKPVEFAALGLVMCNDTLYSHPEMEFVNLMPVPRYRTACGKGSGLAACPSLGLLVTSDCDSNTLSVWSIPSDGGGVGTGAGCASGLARVCTLGGEWSPAPMQFKFFSHGDMSGYLAFIPSAPGAAFRHFPHLLLVTDHGHDAVHMIDVMSRAHVGFLATPGTIAGPRGVAVSGVAPLVAVSAWKEWTSGDHVVHIYRPGSYGSPWTHVRVIGGGFDSMDGRMKWPFGLRFSADGAAICVADRGNHRVSVFRVDDGVFVRHIAKGLRGPRDVEEVEGGWVVACVVSHTVEFMSDGGGRRSSLGSAGNRPGIRDGKFFYPTALALVPGLGLVVREWGNNGRLQVFSTPDILAMQCMSASRVGWMTATFRAVVKRQSLRGARRRLE